MVNILVERKKQSYSFKADPLGPDSFENNWKNNSLDSIAIRAGSEELCRFPCQTVANYCFGGMATASTVPWGDTVAPGNFTVRAFAEPRGFHGEIHAITETRDIDGEWIGRDAMQLAAGGFQNGRWLIHDRYSFNAGRDTNYAWSAGCFILSSAGLAAFNAMLRKLGVRPGGLIPGALTEI
ncbi:MAG: hypothetical protein FWH38_06835 [Treponema sp.]|nr:hypothetical protein [Treponema sp.]